MTDVLKLIFSFIVFMLILSFVGDVLGNAEDKRINTICSENFEEKEIDYQEEIYYLKSKYCPLVKNNDVYCKNFKQEKADRELVRKPIGVD